MKVRFHIRDVTWYWYINESANVKIVLKEEGIKAEEQTMETNLTTPHDMMKFSIHSS